MSALMDRRAVTRPMTVASLDGVLALEAEVYPFPWTRGNFVDSLVAGYAAWTLNHVDGDLIGYCVAMAGVEEMHLLNITIAPSARRRGACALLAELLQLARLRQAGRLARSARQWRRARDLPAPRLRRGRAAQGLLPRARRPARMRS
jgi:ribosomal-protein-alanine N-acetyltransferase